MTSTSHNRRRIRFRERLKARCLSIADKADTIAGMFALGLQPTGSKDPFALRRQANGIVRTIAEHKLPIGVGHFFELARETYRGSDAEKKFAGGVKYAESIRAFIPRAAGVLSQRSIGLQVRRGQCCTGGGSGRYCGRGGESGSGFKSARLGRL